MQPGAIHPGAPQATTSDIRNTGFFFDLIRQIVVVHLPRWRVLGRDTGVQLGMQLCVFNVALNFAQNLVDLLEVAVDGFMGFVDVGFQHRFDGFQSLGIAIEVVVFCGAEFATRFE